MEIKAGTRLRSSVCHTEVVVVKAPTTGETIECGGVPMVSIQSNVDPGGVPAPGCDAGTAVGKRYSDDGASVEVLCTKAGKGSLALAGQPLFEKAAKPLPSSD